MFGSHLHQHMFLFVFQLFLQDMHNHSILCSSILEHMLNLRRRLLQLVLIHMKLC